MSLNDFEIGKVLGKGAFGSVSIVKRKEDGKIYAMKRVKIAQLCTKEKENAFNEVRILASLSHLNIIGYKEAFFDDPSKTLNIIMEFADDGDIASKIKNNAQSRLSIHETTIWQWLIQIIQGLQYLHDNKIMHRDLKSANIFLMKNGTIKLGDLNVSKIAKLGMASTQTGTPYYASPEIWKDQPYDYKCDIWSVGCIIYELCTLRPPFRGTSLGQLNSNINKGIYDPIPRSYSLDLAKIIEKMLIVDPSKRLSCNQLLSNEIILKKLKETKIESGPTGREKVNLMKTIKLPRNIRDINKELPKKRYNKIIEEEMMENDEYETVKNFYKNNDDNSSNQVNQIICDNRDNKQKELDKEKERQRQRERERERERQKELEKEKEKERVKAQEREKERIKAQEREKELEKEKERQREREKQKELEREKERQREREKQKELEREKERIKAQEKERELEKEKEREKQREKERIEKELEKERLKELEKERLKELEKEKEREKQREKKKKNAEEREKEREWLKAHEREKEKERARLKEIEREREEKKKQIEIEREIEREREEKIKQIDREKEERLKELEKGQEREREREREKVRIKKEREQEQEKQQQEREKLSQKEYVVKKDSKKNINYQQEEESNYRDGSSNLIDNHYKIYYKPDDRNWRDQQDKQYPLSIDNKIDYQQKDNQMKVDYKRENNVLINNKNYINEYIERDLKIKEKVSNSNKNKEVFDRDQNNYHQKAITEANQIEYKNDRKIMNNNGKDIAYDRDNKLDNYKLLDIRPNYKGGREIKPIPKGNNLIKPNYLNINNIQAAQEISQKHRGNNLVNQRPPSQQYQDNKIIYNNNNKEYKPHQHPVSAKNNPNVNDNIIMPGNNKYEQKMIYYNNIGNNKDPKQYYPYQIDNLNNYMNKNRDNQDKKEKVIFQKLDYKDYLSNKKKINNNNDNQNKEIGNSNNNNNQQQKYSNINPTPNPDNRPNPHIFLANVLGGKNKAPNNDMKLIRFKR